MQIEPDGSSGKKVTVAACCFMGLAHILYLKQYIKGLLYALLELLFIVAIPFFAKKLFQLVTLPYNREQKMFPVFMLIDGILVISVILIFIALYVI
ncbi:MAG: sugar ABC transporter permease, partial [Treponema sp.]|nr:sugar ABC transporter permease [Treponema sp.]